MMRALGALDLVRAWEWGESRHPVDRALVLLGLGMPAIRRDDLAVLPLGRRDGLLLRLRALTLGPELEVFVSCGKCQGTMEFSVAIDDLVPGVVEPIVPEPFVVEVGEERARCRLPNSLDLMALVGVKDRGMGAMMLVRRCVLAMERGGVVVPVGAASDGLLTGLAARIAEEDPLAVIRFDMDCVNCENRIGADLDVVGYFWEEISAQVKRLSREVHQLAQAYGWSEREILQMTTARRRWYLDMLE